MSTCDNTREELSELAARFREGLLTTDQIARLNDLLAHDPAALDLFARYSLLESLLEFEAGAMQPASAATEGSGLAAGDESTAGDLASAEPPPLPAIPSPLPPATSSPVLGFLGGLFGSAGGSHILRFILWAAGIFGSGLLVLLVVLAVGALTDRSVARLTAGVNCQWQDADTVPDRSGGLPPGRTLNLTAGVAEITFNRGAKVILEAPATFRVETDNSGYLEMGKLVANVPKEALGFAIDAACANVVDLGTEFAVEVDRSGRGQAHVLSGKIALEPHPATAAKSTGGKPAPPARIELRQGEAASVATNREVKRMAAQPERFLAELPATFAFPNTGAGLGPGQADPHWQIVAASSDAKFEPRAAEVVRPDASIMDAYRERGIWRLFGESQYISVAADAPDLEAYKTWTFRTTFDLDGFDPATARLEGRFFADDQVKEIRLNGRSLATPKDRFKTQPLRIEEGFVAGKNTMEWVVWNAGRRNRGPSPIALRVELLGRARRK